MAEITTLTYTPDEIRAMGCDDCFMALPVTIVSSQTALSPGAPLGQITASGKYKLYADANVDGSGVFSGFLCNAVDPAGEGRDVVAAMWVTGYFVNSKVVALGFDAAAKADVAGARVIPGRDILILPGC